MADFNPRQVFQSQHSRSRIPPINPRHPHPVTVAKIAAKSISIAAFMEIVNFQPQNATAFFINPHPVSALAPLRMVLKVTGNSLKNLQIDLEQLPQSRSLHLDHHFRARMQLSFVYLTQTCSSQGHWIKAVVEFLNCLAQILLYNYFQLLVAESRHFILQLRKFLDKLCREQIGAVGK